jgi:hypothetical protein
MRTTVSVFVAFVLSTLAGSGLSVGGTEKVDKTIQITREDQDLKFVEQGETKAKVVSVVVGQTVRWENKSAQDYRVVSDLKLEGKPLFDTGVIKAGEHKDILFDFQMYRKAGGKPANVVKVKYHGVDHEADRGELHVLSAARRSVGRR